MKRSTKVVFMIATLSFLIGSNIFAAHNHKFLPIWDSDEDFHWHPASCHDDAQSEIAHHTFTEWELLKESTETEEGCKIRICKVCKYEDLVKFPKLDHVHKFAETWSTDDFIHWKGSTCGHDEIIKEPSRHSYSRFEITKPATEKEEGTKSRKCAVCGYEDIIVLSKLEHVHVYSENWSNDEFIHWIAPVCEHANAIKDGAKHKYSSWVVEKAATSSEEGLKKRNCSVCGYEETAIISMLGHTHQASTEWSSDEMYHFHKCKGCDKETGNKKHTYGEWITESASTCAAKGSKYKKCSVCGYKYTEEIAINEDAHKWGTAKCELCGKKRDSQGSVVNEKWMAKTGNLKINGKEILKTSEVVVIPKGEFAYIDGEGDEGVFVEDRKVKLSPYVMGQYEVTRDLYKAVMGKDPSEAPANGVAGQNPVNCVRWGDAIMFCNKLSKLCGLECVYYLEIDDVNEINPDKWQKELGESLYWRMDEFLETDLTKNGYRLPTEAEWEFAARGGNPDSPVWKYEYSGIDAAKGNSNADANLKTVAWFSFNSKDKTNVVGLKTKNSLNIYDMSGNVWEWCFDFYGGDNEKDYGRVFSGGGYDSSADYCSVFSRDYSYARYKHYYSNLGFRLVRSSSK